MFAYNPTLSYTRLPTSPTDRACFGKAHSDGPSFFHISLNTTNVASLNNMDAFKSVRSASTDKCSLAADLNTFNSL